MSTPKPSKPGMYWVKRRNRKPEVVTVYQSHLNDNPVFRVLFVGCEKSYLVEELTDCAWLFNAVPIVCPLDLFDYIQAEEYFSDGMDYTEPSYLYSLFYSEYLRISIMGKE